MSSGCVRSSKKASVGRAAGPAVRIGERHLGGLPFVNHLIPRSGLLSWGTHLEADLGSQYGCPWQASLVYHIEWYQFSPSRLLQSSMYQLRKLLIGGHTCAA